MLLRPLIAVIALFTTVSLPVAAAAKEQPLRLAPASKWALDYAEDSCRLVRMFGEGADQTVLLIERFEPSEVFSLIVAGKPLRSTEVRSEAKLRFGPDQSEQKQIFSSGDFADRPALVFHSSMTIRPKADANASDQGDIELAKPVQPDEEAAVSYLAINTAARNTVILDTGSMGAPFQALRTCTDTLVEHWGLDVKQQASLSRKAKLNGSEQRIASAITFPPGLRITGANGLVRFRLSIDANGEPTACHIQRSSRPEGFDKAVCGGLMRRAHFDPALDAEGRPVASYYVNLVYFQNGN